MADSDERTIDRLENQIRTVRGHFRGEPSELAGEAPGTQEPTQSPDLKAIRRMRDTLETQAHRLLSKGDVLDTEARGLAIVERARAEDVPEAPAETIAAAAPTVSLDQVWFGQGHLSIVIADPPDVDEMTNGQHALARQAAVEGVAGTEYLGDNGWIRLVLRGSMTVGEIMRLLRQPLRGRLEVESVSEEDRQVRLRCIPDVAPEPDESGLQTRRWLRH